MVFRFWPVSFMSLCLRDDAFSTGLYPTASVFNHVMLLCYPMLSQNVNQVFKSSANGKIAI